MVINKSDLKKKHKEKPNLTISLKNNKSLDILWKKINQKIKNLVNTSSGPTISSEREYTHIIKSIRILENINFNSLNKNKSIPTYLDKDIIKNEYIESKISNDVEDKN